MASVTEARGLSAGRSALAPWIRSSHCRLLLACFPKSGSSYLATILAGLPGFQKVSLVPGYGRREQELAAECALSTHLTTPHFVAQHHVRFSEETQRVMQMLSLRPLVLVRNIFDVVVSIRDHLRTSNQVIAQAFVPPGLKHWIDEQIDHFTVNLILPWYFNFYASWSECATRLELTYERLRADPLSVLQDIQEWAGILATQCELQCAIECANAEPEMTRFNRGVCGRGRGLSREVVQRIEHLSRYYGFLDLSALGLNFRTGTTGG